MKKVIGIICLIALAAAAQRYSMQMDAEGNILGMETIKNKNKIVVWDDANPPVEGNLVAYSEEGIVDTGVQTEDFVWQAGFEDVAMILSSVGQPNGIAQLDEEGKIDANLIQNITVVFTGAEATE